MESNQYESIGKKYRITKNQPWRKWVEEYTLFELMPNDLKDKKLLDLACGDGFYIEKFIKRYLLSEIVGVDISEEMISLAKPSSDGKIEYIIGDASKINLDKKFDVITGIYLLNYAQSEEELDKFVKVIKQHLDKDGEFIGINSYMTTESFDYKKYGFEKDINGTTITWKYYDDNKDIICQFDNYYLSEHVYERVFEQNKLSLKWYLPTLDRSQGLEDWIDFFNNPPIVFMQARHIE